MLKCSRMEYYDIVKIIAIFLVIWGHVVQQTCLLNNAYQNIIYQTIYTIHMPIFMIMSGLFFRKSLKRSHSTPVFIRKLKFKILKLIIPTIIFGGENLF